MGYNQEELKVSASEQDEIDEAAWEAFKRDVRLLAETVRVF